MTEGIRKETIHMEKNPDDNRQYQMAPSARLTGPEGTPSPQRAFLPGAPSNDSEVIKNNLLSWPCPLLATAKCNPVLAETRTHRNRGLLSF